jgi:hypothetical protein
MGLRLNGSTSGYSEINPPAVAGDQTFVLPGTGGDLLTDGSDITAQVKTATNASGTAPIYACRAWVNFNGTGTVAIRASGNVSSITDNGTGDYTVNFATAMPDADYSAITSGGDTPAGTAARNYNTTLAAKATTSVEIIAGLTSSGNVFDAQVVTVAIFR